MPPEPENQPAEASFVGFGHSHIVALAKGAYALQARRTQVGGTSWRGHFVYLYAPEVEPALTDTPAGPALHPRILERLRSGAPRFVLASIGGNEHNILAIPQASRRFDFILGENPDLPLDPSAEILPESVVRETLRSWMREKTDVLLAIRAATSLPIFLIEPPPPLPREQVLAYPKEFFRSMVGRRSMSSDALRWKMWRVQTGIYRELCETSRIDYVTVPQHMIDTDGMLIQSLCGQDATHANEAFGEAMTMDVLRRYASASSGAT